MVPEDEILIMVVKYSHMIRLQWKQSEINAEHFS